MAQKKKDSGRSARPTPSPVVLEIPVCRQPREGPLAPDASILPSTATDPYQEAGLVLGPGDIQGVERIDVLEAANV